MSKPNGLLRASAEIPDQGATVSFHGTLRAMIRCQHLTLQSVRKRLADNGYPVGLSTLSDWQHGRSRPASVEIVHALEEVLALPLDSLASLIPRTDLSERSGALGELLGTFPGAQERSVDILSKQDRVWVSETGAITRIATQLVLRARRDGVDSYVLRYFADPGTDLGRVDIEAIANCAVGAVRSHDHAPVLVAELLFHQQLRAGETWILEHQLTNPACTPSMVFANAVRHRMEHYVLQIRFDPAAAPVECHAFTQTDLYEPKRRTASLALSAHRTVHLIGTPLITGLHGITWKLPPA
jgi:hypothetical protein